MFASLLEAVLIIALAGLGIADAWRLSHVVRGAAAFHDVIGPDRYLGAISGGLLVCGIAYLLSPLKLNRHSKAPKTQPPGVEHLQVLLVSAVLVLYVLAFPVLGYLPATILFFPVTFFIFGVRPWLKSAWVGILTAVLFYLIFFHLAEIPLPKGLLELSF